MNDFVAKVRQKIDPILAKEQLKGWDYGPEPEPVAAQSELDIKRMILKAMKRQREEAKENAADHAAAEDQRAAKKTRCDPKAAKDTMDVAADHTKDEMPDAARGSDKDEKEESRAEPDGNLSKYMHVMVTTEKLELRKVFCLVFGCRC